ncbi:MAG: hypothetical protein ACOC0J_03185, partial [Myxococcota bacterium]
RDAFEIDLEERYESRIVRKSAQWFKFTTAHGEETFDLIEVDVEVDDPDLAVRLEVYDTDGRSVTEATADAAGADMTHTFATRGATFYLRFSGWDLDSDEDLGSSGEYAFTAKNLHANDEFAGNHSWGDAYELELGVDHDGVLVTPEEEDYYAFTTAHSAETYDEMIILLAVRSTELRAKLDVVDPEGKVVYQEVAPAAGEGLAHSFITMGDGPFMLRVRGWHPEEDREHGSAGAYRLKVMNAYANDEFAPNHTLDDAQEIELDVRYEGALVCEEEADYYVFTTAHTADEYDTVAFQVTPRDPELTAYIELYDEWGNQSNLTARSPSPGESAGLGWVSPGGVRVIRVSGWDSQRGRDHGSAGAYYFKAWNLDANDPFMGNHKFEHAYPIELDTDYDAVLLCIYETDWFLVQDAKPGQIYEVNTVVPLSDLALHVEVYDSEARRIHEATASANGEDLTTSFESPGESFVVRFSGWSIAYDVDNGSRGAYSFNIAAGG